ncbi:hypothetical protein Pmani_027932 [Petrolisthes manimaculis]|uniref:Uncharacterized protein n=1 Tax=Petrolisthes manimaculis TaxID=1843537 RepID=A0AAE1P204_9EUCA|nr:hypothetical protein Pmani_027932 [Petrolisthes manimaculis]
MDAANQPDIGFGVMVLVHSRCKVLFITRLISPTSSLKHSLPRSHCLPRDKPATLHFTSSIPPCLNSSQPPTTNNTLLISSQPSPHSCLIKASTLFIPLSCLSSSPPTILACYLSPRPRSPPLFFSKGNTFVTEKRGNSWTRPQLALIWQVEFCLLAAWVLVVQ